MRLIALHVYKWDKEDAKMLCTEQNLQELWFYQRGMAKELINFNSRTIAGRIPPGNQASITLEQGVGVCHCWTSHDGISATAMTDADYPERSAYQVLNKVIMAFREQYGSGLDKVTSDMQLSFPQLEVIMKEWQNPMEADKLLKVESTLIETQKVVHKNLEDLLKRGEQMDELMSKAKDLSDVSIGFYKKAKKQNQTCCSVS